uniref:Histone-lysine N-methyltransferase n=1 Tax=Compsopogon caeruleus TaxID=31354 RepID=A0A7S1T9B3_9RHOD
MGKWRELVGFRRAAGAEWVSLKEVLRRARSGPLEEKIQALGDNRKILQQLRYRRQQSVGEQPFLTLPGSGFDRPITEYIRDLARVWVGAEPIGPALSKKPRPASVAELCEALCSTLHLKSDDTLRFGKAMLRCRGYRESLVELCIHTLQQTAQTNLSNSIESIFWMETLQVCSKVLASLEHFIEFHRKHRETLVDKNLDPNRFPCSPELMEKLVDACLKFIATSFDETVRNSVIPARIQTIRVMGCLMMCSQPPWHVLDLSLLDTICSSDCAMVIFQIALRDLPKYDSSTMNLVIAMSGNKKFLAALLDQDNETFILPMCKKLLEAFSDLSSKTVSLVLDSEVGLLLDLVAYLCRSPKIRSLIVSVTHTRTHLLTGVAGVLRIADECLNEVEHVRSEDPESQTEHDTRARYLIDRFLEVAVNIFGIFGFPLDSTTLLRCLVDQHFRSRRGSTWIRSVITRLRTMVISSKLSERERNCYTLAEYNLLQVLSDGTQDREKESIPDSADEVSSSDKEGDRSSAAKKSAPTVRVNLPLPSRLIPRKSREFSVEEGDTAELVVKEIESRKRRKTGEGDRPAPFVQIERNCYVGDARSMIRRVDSDDEDVEGEDSPACSCVKVPSGQSCVDEKCLNWASSVECNPETCTAGSSCGNQRFLLKQYKDVKLFKAGGHKGWGLRAGEDVPAGSFIIEYTGEVIDESEYALRTEQYMDEKNFYFMTLRWDLYLDASRKGNIARFVNHSCEPNAKTQKWMSKGLPVIGIFASQDILKGEEICFDYRLQRSKHVKNVRCECGSARCRGWLTGGLESDSEAMEPGSVEPEKNPVDEDQKQPAQGHALDSADVGRFISPDQRNGKTKKARESSISHPSRAIDLKSAIARATGPTTDFRAIKKSKKHKGGINAPVKASLTEGDEPTPVDPLSEPKGSPGTDHESGESVASPSPRDSSGGVASNAVEWGNAGSEFARTGPDFEGVASLFGGSEWSIRIPKRPNMKSRNEQTAGNGV